MGFFDTKSTVKNETANYDQRVGAEGGGVAQRVDAAAGSTVNVGSDAVATAAINAAGENLERSQNFLSEQLSNLYNLVDSRASSAENNVAAAQALAAEVVGKSQEGATDQLMKMLWIIGGMALAAYALKTGVFK